MIYVTIIICTLLIVVCVLGWKYLSKDYTIEAAQASYLNSISLISGKLLDKYDKWTDAEDADKYKYQPRHEEIMDIIDNIHKLSTEE